MDTLNLPVIPVHIPRSTLAQACLKWGKKLWVAPGVDGPKLLWALSGCESSFGYDCAARHEMAYCTGIYSANPEVVALTKQFGHGAHCSYGPWQLLLVNCLDGMTPEDFANVDRAAMETVGFINRRILKGEGAKTVAEIADAYNSGDWRDRNVPAQYIADCTNYYVHTTLPLNVG